MIEKLFDQTSEILTSEKKKNNPKCAPISNFYFKVHFVYFIKGFYILKNSFKNQFSICEIFKNQFSICEIKKNVC